MKKNLLNICAVMVAVMFLGITSLEHEAYARAGSSRSLGSRGSRSYSQPAKPSPQPSQQRQQVTPAPSPYQQQQGGGFLRSMAGGIMGGLLGGMLFRSLGFGGGGMGGGGIGLFEIILLAGIAYLIYRFIQKKRTQSPTAPFDQGGYQGGGTATPYASAYQDSGQTSSDVDAGLSHVRQLDPAFEESRFNDLVMDYFFKIQGAWMNRDLSSVSGILTDEMKRVFQEDIDRLVREKHINRLENIAVRNVEIVEVWQEAGQDYISALIYANLLDYTTDDATGAVVAGSKTETVKFEEYWTFTRPVGNNPWRLSAIDQK